MSKVIGIDLGTTNCTVTAIDESGKTKVLLNRDGEIITPSAVYFTAEKNKVIVGKRAKKKSDEDPKNLVLFVKREMGKDKEEVRQDSSTGEYHPFVFWDKTFSPEEISAYILKHCFYCSGCNCASSIKAVFNVGRRKLRRRISCGSACKGNCAGCRFSRPHLPRQNFYFKSARGNLFGNDGKRRFYFFK